MDFENFAIENADTVEEYRESLRAYALTGDSVQVG